MSKQNKNNNRKINGAEAPEVLVVNDHKIMLDAFQACLESLPCRIILADTLEQMREHLRRSGPSIRLIILDRNMGGGKTTDKDLVLVKEQFPGIVVIGASSSEESRRQQMALGCDYVCAPADVDKLLEIVSQVLPRASIAA